MTNEAKQNEDVVEPLVRHGFLTRAGVLAKLADGWELGVSTGFNFHAWMQQRLCCGGDRANVRMSTLHAMIDRGLVVRAPMRDDDAFWLVRYVLPNTHLSGSSSAPNDGSKEGA